VLASFFPFRRELDDGEIRLFHRAVPREQLGVFGRDYRVAATADDEKFCLKRRRNRGRRRSIRPEGKHRFDRQRAKNAMEVKS
jgi:hypothetical protein